MQNRQLGNGWAIAVGNPALPPHVKALVAKREPSANDAGTYRVDQLVMGMPVGHGYRRYQRFVDTSSRLSLIASIERLPHKRSMNFGERLRAAIKKAGYKSERRFALDLGWDPATAAQRLSNYIIKNRIPDRDTLAQIARQAKTTPEELLNEADDPILRDILLRLFELEGIPEDRADILASAFLAARRLLATFPDEGELQTRARLAAHSAWQTQPHPGLGTQ